MTNLTRLLPLLALLVPLSIPAFAEAITVTASRNATTPLRMIWVYNRATCYGAAFPKIILRKPKNGKLSYRKTKVKVPKGKRCAGKTAYAVTVYYRPNRGFRGTENARFGFSYPRYSGEINRMVKFFDAKITVR